MQGKKDKPRVGISSCLLGEAVRYNGAHKYSSLCVEELGALLTFVPTCPELGAGFGVPRPPLRLVVDADSPSLRRVQDGEDLTPELHEYAATRLPQLSDLCGYIFMENSPSCGVSGVKLFDAAGKQLEQGGQGLFVAALLDRYPWMPVVEEAALYDAEEREHFLERVFVVDDWQALCRAGISAAALIRFHSRYKYALMAHDPGRYNLLGRILAEAGGSSPQTLAERYFPALMQLLQRPATRRSKTNVLMHLQGHLKKQLSADQKAELCAVIDAYRREQLDLEAPLTLLRQHFQTHPDPFVAQQMFLQPRPWQTTKEE